MLIIAPRSSGMLYLICKRAKPVRRSSPIVVYIDLRPGGGFRATGNPFPWIHAVAAARTPIFDLARATPGRLFFSCSLVLSAHQSHLAVTCPTMAALAPALTSLEGRARAIWPYEFFTCGSGRGDGRPDTPPTSAREKLVWPARLPLARLCGGGLDD